MKWLEFWLSKHLAEFMVTAGIVVLAIVALVIFMAGASIIDWIRYKLRRKK